MVRTKAVYSPLKATRAHPDDVPTVPGPGADALFAKEDGCSPSIVFPADRLF